MTTAGPQGLVAPARSGAAGLSWRSQETLLGSAPEDDPDRFRHRLNESYRVEIAARRSWSTQARIRAVRLSHLTLGFVRFGTAATVEPDRLTGYHVNIPLAGRVVSRYGEQEAVGVPGRAMVFGPDGTVALPEWAPRSAQLCIKVDRGALERELEGLLGRTLGSVVSFRLDADLASTAGARWLTTTALMMDVADDGGPAMVSAHLERLWLDQLLMLQRHQYSEELSGERPLLTPRPVKRVVDLVDSSEELAFTLGDLARHAGVSARALQYGFLTHRGMTPMAYLRAVRLDRARDDLAAGQPTVAEVMARWHFHNAARFSAQYRARFGETPGTTRARARGER